MNLTEAKEYWKVRASELGYRYVGRVNHSAMEHFKFYDRKVDFIESKIPPHSRVLDFGCGVGMFSQLFNKYDYLGVDICEQGIMDAKELNFKHRFQHIESYDDIKGTYDLIFCMNVLQHIGYVPPIIEEWKRVCPGGYIMLMENHVEEHDHVFPRGVERYTELIGKNFNISEVESEEFEENNLLMKFKV